jgi:hypothetical protein
MKNYSILKLSWILKLPTSFISDPVHEIEARSNANKSHKRDSDIHGVRVKGACGHYGTETRHKKRTTEMGG